MPPPARRQPRPRDRLPLLLLRTLAINSSAARDNAAAKQTVSERHLLSGSRDPEEVGVGWGGGVLNEALALSFLSEVSIRRPAESRRVLGEVTGTYSKDQGGISANACGFICGHVG